MSKLRLTPRLIAVLVTQLTAALILMLAISGSAQAVDIEWVIVGDAGNGADGTGYGAVAYIYRVGKYEVTNAQYAEYLNAVAATDTYGLYNANMGSGYGGITRSGSSGSYTYSTISGRENKPVNWVSFYDALRFANWLHNGRPTGAQGESTTEDGAYDISLGSSVVRKANAKAFLTNEDEWYKAAYYDAVSMTYNPYPFADGFSGAACQFPPGTTSHSANCGWVVQNLTDVGDYTGSPSPNGTFDQGGNVLEWNEATIIAGNRGLRGGAIQDAPGSFAASFRSVGFPPDESSNVVAFRVASSTSRVPSLSPVGMALLGGLVFAIAVAGLAVQRRRRAE